MKLFKTDFTRFFLFGFMAGAALVVTMMDSGAQADLAHGIVPVAEAAATR